MTNRGGRSYKVWDIAVRWFHWSLVLSFAAAWATGDEWARGHEVLGYAILALVAARLVWGIAGTRYARFWQFVRRPRAVLDYLRSMLSGNEPRYLGHNPAGGAMVVALLTALVATGVTGWMMSLDAFWGVAWVEETHEALASLMLAMVGVHVAGVVLASLRHHENLVRAMIDGRKREPAPGDIA